MALTFIAFCSNDPKTKGDFIYPECVSRNTEIKWESAIIILFIFGILSQATLI